MVFPHGDFLIKYLFSPMGNFFNQENLMGNDSDDDDIVIIMAQERIMLGIISRMKKNNVWSTDWTSIVNHFDGQQFKMTFRMSYNTFYNILNVYARSLNINSAQVNKLDILITILLIVMLQGISTSTAYRTINKRENCY
jgi:hypothetical protein